MQSIIDRNIVMRRMTVHDHSIENNDISIQFLYFTRRNTQYCNNTKQSKAQGHSAIYCTQQKTPFTLCSIHRAVWSIYRVPQNTAGCHCRWQASRRYGQTKVVKYFYKRSIFAKCTLKHRVEPRCWGDMTARPVQNVNWYSRLAQCVPDTKLYITCTNTDATYTVLWKHRFVTHCYRTVTIIIPGP
jgi:hypothetical protein